jgi:hypothetical protein
VGIPSIITVETIGGDAVDTMAVEYQAEHVMIMLFWEVKGTS